MLVAVDVGTSGARASAFTVDGMPRGTVRVAYPTNLPREGWAEQDARRWSSAAIGALGRLAAELGTRSVIRAIGLTGQCPSVVPVDARSVPLRAGIIYRDNRATAQAERMRERFGDNFLHTRTGHLPAAFHVIAKVLWIRDHEPDVFAATRPVRRAVGPRGHRAHGRVRDRLEHGRGQRRARPSRAALGHRHPRCPRGRRGALPDDPPVVVGDRLPARTPGAPARHRAAMCRWSPVRATALPVRWAPG